MYNSHRQSSVLHMTIPTVIYSAHCSCRLSVNSFKCPSWKRRVYDVKLNSSALHNLGENCRQRIASPFPVYCFCRNKSTLLNFTTLITFSRKSTHVHMSCRSLNTHRWHRRTFRRRTRVRGPTLLFSTDCYELPSATLKHWVFHKYFTPPFKNKISKLLYTSDFFFFKLLFMT